jgi:branched-chain amino acid transport system ATP-binding protein
MEASVLLEVRNISKHFGGLAALDNVNISVKEGEFFGIIGPNGAGKTTLFNVITGVHTPTGGKVFLTNKEITHLKTYERARRGIVRSFQQVNVFSQLTVTENLLQGFHSSFQINFWKSFLPTRKSNEQMAKMKDQALDLLRSLEMEPFKDEISGSLPLGIQKKLGIAVALAANPKILLLDEPVSGLNPVEIEAVMHFIQNMVRKRCTCVIIEHHVKTVLNYCDRIMVLQFGRKIAEGIPSEIARNRDVIVAYLGEEEA